MSGRAGDGERATALTENFKDMFRELLWVAKGEELLVYSTELLLVELAGRTIL